MNGYQKERAKTWLEGLSETHGRIREAARGRNAGAARDLLRGCQEGAISIGSRIEETEGEGFSTVAILEGYCEAVYRAYAALEGAGGGEESARGESEVACLEMDAAREAALRSLQRDVPERREVLFLPYKASMWDSLESIWMAADADPSCEAVVVPIPYYDKKKDGSFGDLHYDGGDFPEYVPVTHYGAYSIEERKPDVIYIHNPYDDANLVTSVDPQYYSWKLKKHTGKLVYVPYFATTGNMAESRALCSAYSNVDYIVVQSEKHKKLYDASISRDKILVLGSPKFDKVIRICKNPPRIPIEWEDMVYLPDGRKKKIYFYNTSITGMLEDTRRFLLKMEYVFRTFQGREDCCILWRPHPLLESSIESMRPDFKPFYDLLKNAFFQEKIGIYDETPDIENTVSICDAYIGDAGSSVVTLFGVSGKPIFLLNNFINTLPEEDDWRGDIINFSTDGCDDEWIVTRTDQLYNAPNNDYHYEYYCNLSDKIDGHQYLKVLDIGEKHYVCPANAQDILVISEHGIQKKIIFNRRIEGVGAFYNARVVGDSLFLIPSIYPAIVKVDTRTDEVEYIEGYNEFFIKNVHGVRARGGSCSFQQFLLIASPVGGQVMSVNSVTGETLFFQVGEKSDGFVFMVPIGDHIWLLPFEGSIAICWNFATGERTRVDLSVPGFQCIRQPQGYACTERPFSSVAESESKVIFAPTWGNKFVCVEKKTGKADEWVPPFEMETKEKNGYYIIWHRAIFLKRTDSLGKGTWRLFNCQNKRLYDINLETNEYCEITISFSKKELEEHEPGFGPCSEWQPYGCVESAFYSLKDFIDGSEGREQFCHPRGIGNPFDRTEQLKIYDKVAVNIDGTCGSKVHEFIINSLS